MELLRLNDKVAEAARKKALAENPEVAKKPGALRKAVGRLKKSITSEVLTPEELRFLELGQSNAAYHYMGSAYTYGKIGQAFAEAMIAMEADQ